MGHDDTQVIGGGLVVSGSWSGNILLGKAPFIVDIEYDAGRLEVQDGRHNWDGRLQIATQYDLFK